MKKIIMLILTIALSAGFCIASAAEESAFREGDSFKIEFLDLGETTYFTSETAGTNWAIDTGLSDARQYDGTTANAAWVQINNNIPYNFITINSKGDFVLKFTAPVTGTYKISAQITPYKTGGGADIIVNGTKVGSIDSYGTSPEIDKANFTTVWDFELDSALLNSGELANTITVRPTGASQSTGSNTFLEGFTFTAESVLQGKAFDLDFDVNGVKDYYIDTGRYYMSENTTGANWSIDTTNTTSQYYCCSTTSAIRLQSFLTIPKRNADKGNHNGGAAQFAVKFTPEESGVYDVSVYTGRYYYAGIADIYLIDGEKRTFLGTANTYKAGDGSVASVETELLPVLLEGGKEYSIAICQYAPGNASNANNTYLYKYSFIPIAGNSVASEVASDFTVDSKTSISYSLTKPSAVAYSKSGTVEGAISATVEENSDGTYKMTAPETDGYTFLYWAKGLTSSRRIVSYAAEFDYKATANENNILIAVYEKKGVSDGVAKAEFYNANGQLIGKSENSVSFPELPTMAGYGEAKGWKCYNNGNIYLGNEADIELSDTMIFVADYDKETPDTVYVNGIPVTYGEKYTCTSSAPEGKTLLYWTKTVNDVAEVVSTDESYSFFAWENCTVNAVYGDEKPMFKNALQKIVVDTFGIDSVMAEFIGFENAIERGILYNGTKIPMTTDANQFTVSGEGSYKGYVIIADSAGNKIEITDGYAVVE